MAHRGKAYLQARERLDREHEYSPAGAVALAKELSQAKFNESMEVHVRTGLNVRHADEQLRGTVALPNGLGKEVKIVVFAQGERPGRPRVRARTSWVPRTWPSAFRMALMIST